jgi:predicted RecA/RadA family phage recombinase
MGAKIVKPGISVSHKPGSDVDLGDIIIQGDLVGIAGGDVQAGSAGKLWLTGIFNIVKATGTGTSISAGTKIYWDATNKQASTTDSSGTHKLLGKAIRDAGEGDRFVRVILTP